MAAVKQSNKKKVSELLVKLGKSNNQTTKRKIRSDLRKLGHKGGLGKKTKRVKAAKVKKVKKVTKKAA